MTLTVFVGYDVREHPAWLVCRETLIHPAASPEYQENGLDINVVPLSHKELRRQGLFDREWTIDKNGQPWDNVDGRPFSTDFSHSRFLVPHIAKQMGIKGPVVFVDCDFMFLEPITQMLDGLDRSKVISVVKHDTSTLVEGTKMDGVKQTTYSRKLWSSLMVFNMSHPDIDRFSKDVANIAAGSELHGLLGLPDSEIGEISSQWNYIPTMTELASSYINANAVHWSMGGPWMKGYEKAMFAPLWRDRFKHVTNKFLAGDMSELYPLS